STAGSSSAGSRGRSPPAANTNSARRTAALRSSSVSWTCLPATYAATTRSTSDGVFVRDREHFVEDGDPLLELFARDRQRRADHDDGPARHQVHPPLQRGLVARRHQHGGPAPR